MEIGFINKNRRLRLSFQILFVVLIFMGAFYLTNIVKETGAVREYINEFGYLGIFVVAFLSGFNLIVPVPVVAFMPVILEAGLNLWITIVIVGLGMSIADIVAYMLGRIGNRLAHVYSYRNDKVIDRLEKIKDKYKIGPLMVLFLFAMFAPLPNEILVVPMGFMGYRLRNIFPIVFAGNFIFCLLYSISLLKIFESF